MSPGFVLDHDGTRDTFEHSGANRGYQCYLMDYPDLPFGSVIMTNSDNVSRIFQVFLDAVFEAYLRWRVFEGRFS